MSYKYIVYLTTNLKSYVNGTPRIYVGVHYPSDIIAGYSLAIIIIILLVQLEKCIKIEGGRICIK